MEEKKKTDVAIVYLRDGLVIKESHLSFCLSVIMRLLCKKEKKKKLKEKNIIRTNSNSISVSAVAS